MEPDCKNQFEKLLRSEEYTDFTISCCHVQWKVHRSVLAARSGFFKELFEKHPSELGYDPHTPLGSQTIIDLALQAIYTGDYSLDAVPPAKKGLCQEQDPAQTDIICHSVLRRFAEVWRISDLWELTLKKEEQVLRANIESLDFGWAITPYYLGWRGTGFMPSTRSWTSGHALSLHVMRQNRERLLRRPSFHSILKACPDFATDLSGEDDPSNERTYLAKTACQCSMPHEFQLQCAACKDVFVRGRAAAEEGPDKHNLPGQGTLARFEFPKLDG